MDSCCPRRGGAGSRRCSDVSAQADGPVLPGGRHAFSTGYKPAGEHRWSCEGGALSQPSSSTSSTSDPSRSQALKCSQAGSRWDCCARQDVLVQGDIARAFFFFFSAHEYHIRPLRARNSLAHSRSLGKCKQVPKVLGGAPAAPRSSALHLHVTVASAFDLPARQTRAGVQAAPAWTRLKRLFFFFCLVCRRVCFDSDA